MSVLGVSITAAMGVGSADGQGSSSSDPLAYAQARAQAYGWGLVVMAYPPYLGTKCVVIEVQDMLSRTYRVPSETDDFR